MEVWGRNSISVVSGPSLTSQGPTGSGSFMWPQDMQSQRLSHPLWSLWSSDSQLFASVYGKRLISVLPSSLYSAFKLICHEQQL